MYSSLTLKVIACAYTWVFCRNPCTSTPKYRDAIILAASDCLQQLDGEEVKPAHRAFLQALQGRRAKARQQQPQPQQQLLLSDQHEGLSQQVSSMHLGRDPSTGAAGQLDPQQLSPRAQAAGGTEAQGPAVSGVKLQLATALQPCRAGAARPSRAAGFKPSPKRAAMQHRGPGAAGAAAGALDGNSMGLQGPPTGLGQK